MISRVLDELRDLPRRFTTGEDLRAVLDGARRSFAIQSAAAGLNYSSQIILALVLGARGFGIYVFAWSLVGPLSVAATMGLGSAALRFVPQYSVSEDWGRVRGFIRRGTAITLSVGVGMAVIGWWALPALSSLTGDYYIDPTRVALLCIPLLAFCGLLSGVSRSFGWVGLAFAPRLLMIPGLLILSLLGLTLFVDQPTALQALVLAVVTCVAAVLGQFVGFRRGISKEIRGAPPVFETRLWLRVAFPLFLSEGVFLVLWSSDAVMLGSMTVPDDVAVYHACVRTAGLTLVFFKALTALAAPRFAALWVAGDTADQERFARAVARWAFLPTLALVLGLIVVGPYVLATFGESFVRGYPALILLALGYLAKAATGPTTEYLAVSGNHNVIMLVTAMAAVTNIGFNLLLIPHFGVMGAASASVLSILLFQALQYLLVRRRLGVDAFFVALGSAR